MISRCIDREFSHSPRPELRSKATHTQSQGETYSRGQFTKANFWRDARAEPILLQDIAISFSQLQERDFEGR